jgi:Na+-translocating ferredoxin:NAD+ oxidoreductase subunit D
MSVLKISGSPHVHTDDSVRKIMNKVIYAMIPAMLISFYFFGLGAVKVMLVSVAACLAVEYLIQKYLLKGPSTLNDSSAIVTGMLLAFNVPSSLPIWMIVVGAIVAIGIGKMSFGGLGKNPFNPALVGRVFLLISFPVDMTTWPKPIVSRNYLSFSGLDKSLLDTITGPTPLGILKEGGTELPAYADMLMGNMGGCVGEVSAVALLLGGLYMLLRKVITWHIPVAYMGSVILFAGTLWLIDPTQYVDPLFHLMTGGMMLGIFFMATDMVSSPMSAKGQLLFGIGCGVITMLIRVYGAYPEGVSFAILIMNAFVPIINKSFKPKRFGEVVKNG